MLFCVDVSVSPQVDPSWNKCEIALSLIFLECLCLPFHSLVHTSRLAVYFGHACVTPLSQSLEIGVSILQGFWSVSQLWVTSPVMVVSVPLSPFVRLVSRSRLGRPTPVMEVSVPCPGFGVFLSRLHRNLCLTLVLMSPVRSCSCLGRTITCVSLSCSCLQASGSAAHRFVTVV